MQDGTAAGAQHTKVAPPAGPRSDQTVATRDVAEVAAGADAEKGVPQGNLYALRQQRYQARPPKGSSTYLG
eukprot:7625033-Heterocapsa_arctica.AAC.1